MFGKIFRILGKMNEFSLRDDARMIFIKEAMFLVQTHKNDIEFKFETQQNT